MTKRFCDLCGNPAAILPSGSQWDTGNQFKGWPVLLKVSIGFAFLNDRSALSPPDLCLGCAREAMAKAAKAFKPLPEEREPAGEP